MQRKVLGLSLALLLGLTSSALADVVVTIGNHNLLPNAAGQTIQLTVSGISGDTTGVAPNSVSGLVAAYQTSGGGPGYTGGSPGPKITGIDYNAGPSIWVVPNTPAGYVPGAAFFDGGGQLAQQDLVTTSGHVLVNGGIFVTLTIDTTGFAGGVFPLQMIGDGAEDGIASNFGASTFLFGQGGGVSNITDGTITIVPEPSSVVLGLFAMAGLGAVVIRKRRARRA